MSMSALFRLLIYVYVRHVRRRVAKVSANIFYFYPHHSSYSFLIWYFLSVTSLGVQGDELDIDIEHNLLPPISLQEEEKKRQENNMELSSLRASTSLARKDNGR